MSHEVNLLSVEESQQSPQEDKSKQVIESLLFASSDPLSLKKIQRILASYRELPPRKIRQLLELLCEEYRQSGRAFLLEEMAGGWALRTKKEYSSYVQELSSNTRRLKLSQAASEVLAIIAYRQPITRPMVDGIRGVDSSGTLAALIDRKLIEPVGRADTPGKPTLYATTRRFLHHFGLRDIHELPHLNELRLNNAEESNY